VIAPGEGLAWYPRFSPDGSKILFESSRASFRDLYVVSKNGGEMVRLTDNREGNFDGAWSPDGAQIAFASSRHGQLDLFVMSADGSDQRRLTRHPGDSIRPAFSPDGKHLAFISGRDGRDDLFLIKPDGSELVSLTNGAFAQSGAGSYVERFAFSPDGRAIAYSVRTPRKGSKIWIMELATRTARQLSKDNEDDADPVWSPDGRFLAFTSVVKERADVWLMEASGRRRTRLTESGSAWLPRWLEVAEGSGDS
jgi:TolB protein